MTVAAEVAHWRWRFFMDSDGLRDEQLVTEHTFFQARFAGTELALTEPPWAEHRPVWRHPDEYAPCHELAGCVRALRPPGQSIRYESARREGGISRDDEGIGAAFARLADAAVQDGVGIKRTPHFSAVLRC